MEDVAAIQIGGASMRPTFQPGDVALIEDALPRRGDVAVFWTKSTPLVHRVADRVTIGARTWYVHAGDATGAPGIAGPDAHRIHAERRPASPRAHFLALAFRLGATLAHLGLPPWRAGYDALKKVL